MDVEFRHFAMDLKDVENKLKFNDVHVQCRNVLKLKESVISKSPKGRKISSPSVEIPELTLLWEICGNECFTTGNLVSEALVSLVAEGHVDSHYAINMFISYVGSARNLQAPIHGLTKLLVLRIKAEVNGSGSYKSHYSLQNPKHPLILVLQTRPDSWRLVLQKIVEMLQDRVNGELGFKVMEPLLHFIFSNPAPSDDICQLRNLLCEKLCRTVSDSSSMKLINFMYKSIFWLQVKSFDDVARASDFVLNVKQTLTTLQKSENNLNLESMLFLSLALSHCCVEHGFDALEILEAAEDLSSRILELDKTSSIIDSCFILWVKVVDMSSGNVAQKLLSLGMTLLRKRPLSPVVAAMAIQPVIQMLLGPKVISFESSEESMSLLLELQKRLENCLNSTDSSTDEEESLVGLKNLSAFTPLSSQTLHCLHFSLILKSFHSKVSWLNFIKDQVDDGGNISDFAFYLVVSLFLMSDESQESLQPCLEALKAIVKKQCEKSTKLFSLLLYKLMRIWKPESRLLILHSLTETATHKYAISPVVSVLQLMFKHPGLKAQVICLMLRLWKVHDRCLPLLNKLLCEKNSTISPDTGVPEVLIAQVAAVKEICAKVPEKHGGEFLGFLSKVLNESNDNASSPAACLALEGVHILCQNEVIDIKSTWKTLSPKLCRDKRILVVKKMYKLLSLIPSLRVQSFEYDKFMSEIASYLWKQIASETNPPVVIGYAYEALAGFPADAFVLKQLPAAAKRNLKLPKSMASTPFEMGKLPEDVLSYTPGYCFIDLLKSIKDVDILEGYSKFLDCFVEQEVKGLPRGVYSQRHGFSSKRTSSSPIAQVPEFLCSQCYDNRIPTILKNLAVGLLLSYEPPMEREGRSQLHSLASRTRYYEQVLEILVNEVNLDISEWRRCVVISSAWSNFMEQALFACEEGRRADLEMQQQHGHLEVNKDEMKVQMDSSWLWVRDRFFEIIKNASRNKSSSLGNAILAVGGLTRALDKFYFALDDSVKNVSMEHLNTLDHKTFQHRCAETLICAMNPAYKLSPKAKVFSWMLTHLSRPLTTIGYLIQGCAASSISNSASVLIAEFSDQIEHLLKLLLENVTSSSSSVLQLYSGIGLGLLVKALCQCGYSESHEKHIGKIVEIVETLCSSCIADDEAKLGQIVALTLLISSLCRDGDQSFLKIVESTCYQLNDKLKNVDPSSVDFEVFSVCIAGIAISGAVAGVFELNKILDLINWFEEKRKADLQCTGIAVSLGILVDALQRLGSSDGSDLRQNLFRSWAEILLGEKQPTLYRISALNGLCAMYSSGAGLIQLNNDLCVGDVTVGLNDLVQCIYKLLKAPRDTGLQDACSWQLGLIFSVHSGQQQQSVSVPSTYNTLNETSVLNPLVAFISECAKSDDNALRPQLLVALKALCQDFMKPLPPLNWIAFLTPLLHRTHDSELMERCFGIVVNQMSGSPNAVTLMTAYIIPPTVHTIPVNCRLLLFKKIPQLVNFLPSSKLQLFFQSVFKQAMKDHKVFKEEGLVALQAIVDALKLPYSTKPGITVLHQTLLSVVIDLKTNLPELRQCLPMMCKGLSLLPEDSVNSIITISDEVQDLKPLTMIWCQLVKEGIAPLKSLRKCIEIVQHATESDKQWFIANFFQIFRTSTSNIVSEVNKPEKCILFLMETIGQAKILADSQSQYELESVRQSIAFLAYICLAVIVGCAGFEVGYALWPEMDITHQLLISSLPSSLFALLSKDKWNDVADKIFGWLLFLLKGSYLDEDEKYHIRNSFCLARSFKEFFKSPIWMDIVCCV